MAKIVTGVGSVHNGDNQVSFRVGNLNIVQLQLIGKNRTSDCWLIWLSLGDYQFSEWVKKK